MEFPNDSLKIEEQLKSRFSELLDNYYEFEAQEKEDFQDLIQGEIE